MRMLTTAVLIGSVCLVLGKPEPEGAPEDACESMDPQHGGTPLTSPMPYTITLDTHRVDSNGCVYFTIKAKPGASFAGFMVQARGEREGTAVGIFTDSEDVKFIECFGKPDNTATHINNDPKTEVTMRWVPDNGYCGKVIFHATIVKSTKEYWVQQKAKPLTVQKAKH